MTDTHTTNLDELFELAVELMQKAAEQEDEDVLNVLLSMFMVLPVLGGNAYDVATVFDERAEKFEKIVLSDGITELEAREAMQIFTENALKMLMILVASACADDQVQEKLAAKFRRSIEEAEVELSKS